MKNVFKTSMKTLGIILVIFFLPVAATLGSHYLGFDDDLGDFGFYGSTDQAPYSDEDEAVIQVYAARAARWRGAIGVHTWFATKRSDELDYTRLEVIGYRVRWGRDAVRIRRGTPDSMWFGNYPTLLREIRGDESLDAVIDRLHDAANNYTHADEYNVWPGPNSNTFAAMVGREIPELQLELPSNALGKDYLGPYRLIGKTPSSTGVQFSLRGLAGITLALEEGFELNVLGLTAGVDLFPPAIKLPGIGRIGFPDTRSYNYVN